MTTVGNNTLSKYEQLRESFFTEEERKQFEKIMQNPKEQQIHARLLEQDAKILYQKAMALIKRVEHGEFNDKQMKKVEYKIAHYLSAIVDFHPEKLSGRTIEL